MRELFTAFDQSDQAGTDAGRVLEEQIERCLGEQGVGRQALQARVATLFRAKDLYAYVLEEPTWRGLKLEVLEMVLFHREAPERWAAVRKLLLDALHPLCDVRGAAGAGLEQVKRELTRRDSRIARLLQAVALFNFDGDPETPPENLLIRFVKGRFPEHCWEVEARPGAMGTLALDGGWTPGEPLCRWEFLAADLFHTEIRGNIGREVTGAGQGRRDPPTEGRSRGEIQRFCSLEPATRTGSGGEQLPLLPFQPTQFLADLNREVSRKWGAEGTRALALLFERLSGEPPGGVVDLELETLAGAGDAGGLTARKREERQRKLWSVLERLSQVEVRQVFQVDGRTALRTAPLVALLEVGRDVPPGAAKGNIPADGDGPGRTARVIVEPCFHAGGEPTLAEIFEPLPEVLIGADPRKHPQALSLFLWLRVAWARADGTEPGVVVCSARQLMAESGIWVNESSRYRALEVLKRDLNFLQESGLLDRWNLTKNSTRDAMEDTYRMEAKTRKVGRGADTTIPDSGHLWRPPVSSQSEHKKGGPAGLLSSGG